MVGRQATGLESALGQACEKRRHHPMHFAHREADGRTVTVDRLEPGQVGENGVGKLTVALELDDVLGAERSDQLGRRAEREKDR